MAKKSISKQFNRSIIKVVLVLLLLFSVGVVIYGINKMDRRLNDQLHYVSELAQSSLPSAIWNMDDKAMDDTLNALFLDENIVYLAVVADEEIIAKKHQPVYKTKEFTFFKGSSDFVFLESTIYYEENEAGKVQIVVSKENYKAELMAQVLAIIALSLVLILLITLRSITISKKLIFRPLAGLESSASSIAGGDLDVKISYDHEDEIGSLSRSVDTMRKSAKNLVHDLNEANRGLEKRIEDRTAELTRSADELRKAKEEAENAAKFKEGLNELSQAMQGVQDTRILSKKVLRFMVDYLKLPLGAFFALDGESKFKRFADFGYPHKKTFPDLIAMGSGLIGQAALEGKSITLRDIPDYAKASFGFGEAHPEEILLFPLIYDNQTVGVMELGSFKEFTPNQLNWIKEAGRSISVVLRATLDNTNRKRHAEMLRESEERLELVLEGGGFSFWDVNFQTMKTVVNKQWAEMLGYTLNEIDDVHTLWQESIHPDDRDRVLKTGKDYKEGLISSYEVEYRIYTRQKEMKRVISKGKIVEHDDQGVPTRMVGTVINITERRKPSPKKSD